eukprot:sb/3460948/
MSLNRGPTFISYYILSKLCDRDHLATARAIIRGTWRSPCQLQLGTKGISILHVHSFTSVLMSTSSTPSAVRQRLSRSRRTAAARERAIEYDRLRRRVQASQSQSPYGFAPRRPRLTTPVQYRNLSIGGVAAKFTHDEFLEQYLPSKMIDSSLGSCNLSCPFCLAYKWRAEKESFCCGKGMVSLPSIPPPPPEYVNLLTSHPEIIRKSRAYNNMLCLASLGCNEKVQAGFSPTFTIQGKMYHNVGPLLASNEAPKFCQLYFVDTEMQDLSRSQFMSGLDMNLTRSLKDILTVSNSYIRSFKCGMELMISSPDRRLIIHSDRRPTSEHVRQYNLPENSEVAALLPGDHGGNMDVILHLRDGGIKRINQLNRSYDPMHYVLIYPRGTAGYSLSLRKRNNEKLTELEFYKYRLQIRQHDHWTSPLEFRRLGQQYAVDAWCRIESSRLSWIRHNQTTIKAERYCGLVDASNKDELQDAGTRIVLPATTYATPRWYSARFQDAMACVRKYGKPHLFITFTTNPNWPEIISALKPGESHTDRPDLCVRVFHMKLSLLKDDLLKKEIFGGVKAVSATIEFQKRGLPHAHIVVTLNNPPRTPEDCDKYVSAEIPDPSLNPRLHEIVTRNNIHGPCGSLNTRSPCMTGENEQLYCSKDYPKPLRSYTTFNELHYPEYRRRGSIDGGQFVIKNGVIIDNKWIVPYNPFLSLKYDAHINVEIVHSTMCVKYLFKVVLFNDGEEEETLLEGPPITKLLAFFAKNLEDETSRNILYTDFPAHFTWCPKKRIWQRRKYGGVYSVGRIPIVNLTTRQAEKYYLRLLLHHSPGATSFEDLRRVNGHLCETFHDACVRKGLAENDDATSDIIAEAALVKFGDTLRDFFVNTLLFNKPSDPLRLWEHHRDCLSEDYIDDAYNQCLIYIENRLQDNEYQLNDFNLPPTIYHTIPAESFNRLVQEQHSLNHPGLAETVAARLSTLNREQLSFYEAVLDAVENNEIVPKVFNLQAAGGTGKTYTLNLLLDTVRVRSKIAIATALSGIAATLLNGGRTLHSRCKIPLDITDLSPANFDKRSDTGKLLMQTSLIVIDECTMGHKFIYETLDRSLRFLLDVDVPFGGITVILSGDWRQVLPVVKKGTRGQVVQACLKRSYIWDTVEKFSFSLNMRATQADDNGLFAAYLETVGEGKLPKCNVRGFSSIIEEKYRFEGDVDGLINWVFKDLENNFGDGNWISSRAVIVSTNKSVDEINYKMIDRFPGTEKIYRGYDSVEEDSHLYPPEFLNSLTPSGFPPICLKLKVGCPVILLRNMDPHNGHCNGTRYIIEKLHENILELSVASGAYRGNVILVPRIPMSPTDSIFPFKLTRKQFPIRPSFALTANKSQGQTLTRVGINTEQSFFQHGQLYVAMSRVGNPNELKILTGEGGVTTNVVYNEIL